MDDICADVHSSMAKNRAWNVLIVTTIVGTFIRVERDSTAKWLLCLAASVFHGELSKRDISPVSGIHDIFMNSLALGSALSKSGTF